MCLNVWSLREGAVIRKVRDKSSSGTMLRRLPPKSLSALTMQTQLFALVLSMGYQYVFSSRVTLKIAMFKVVLTNCTPIEVKPQ